MEVLIGKSLVSGPFSIATLDSRRVLKNIFNRTLFSGDIRNLLGAPKDLNAETCARNAVILQLAESSESSADAEANWSRRIWTIFALWRLAKNHG